MGANHNDAMTQMAAQHPQQQAAQHVGSIYGQNPSMGGQVPTAHPVMPTQPMGGGYINNAPGGFVPRATPARPTTKPKF